MGLTPAHRVYNELTFQFDWNEGAKEYNTIWKFEKIDQSAFPGQHDTISGTTHTIVDHDFTLSPGFTQVFGTETITFPERYSMAFKISTIGHNIKVGDTIVTTGNTPIGFNVSGVVYRVEKNTIILVRQDSPETEFTGFLDPFTAYGIFNLFDKPLDNFPSEIPNTDPGSFVAGGTLEVIPAGSQTWKTFAKGFEDGEYPLARNIWEWAHDAFVRWGIKNKIPDSLGTLYWIHDRDTAVAMIELGARWWTTRREIFEYPIALTDEVELLDYVSFTHAFFTNGTEIRGWIVKIKNDLDNKFHSVRMMVYFSLPAFLFLPRANFAVTTLRK